MSVTYKDYYAILGVDRKASTEEIKRAYRRKARELHPDVNKSPRAEEQFRDLNEAYEVLSDPEKRARYDRLGANWKHGAPFEPPPGFEGFRVHVGGMGDLGDIFGSAGGGAGGSGFSDFFETLFGDLGLGGFGRTRTHRPRGRDVEAEVEFGLSDLLHPGPRRITVGVPGAGGKVERKTVTVNLPPGLRPGQKLRLPGMGGGGQPGSPRGDLYLKIRLRPDPAFRIEGDDLVTEVDVPAPLAVVGGHVEVPTPERPVRVRVAPGTSTGTTLRVRGRGLPRKDGGRGDLLARVRLVVPKHPTREQRELYEKLARLERS